MSNISKLTETWGDANVKKGYVLMIVGKQAKARKAKTNENGKTARRGANERAKV